jgi:hypothetical protein
VHNDDDITDSVTAAAADRAGAVVGTVVPQASALTTATGPDGVASSTFPAGKNEDAPAEKNEDIPVEKNEDIPGANAATTVPQRPSLLFVQQEAPPIATATVAGTTALSSSATQTTPSVAEGAMKNGKNAGKPKSAPAHCTKSLRDNVGDGSRGSEACLPAKDAHVSAREEWDGRQREECPSDGTETSTSAASMGAACGSACIQEERCEDNPAGVGDADELLVGAPAILNRRTNMETTICKDVSATIVAATAVPTDSNHLNKPALRKRKSQKKRKMRIMSEGEVANKDAK